jgi:hypothetical protein
LVFEKGPQKHPGFLWGAFLLYKWLPVSPLNDDFHENEMYIITGFLNDYPLETLVNKAFPC